MTAKRGKRMQGVGDVCLPRVRRAADRAALARAVRRSGAWVTMLFALVQSSWMVRIKREWRFAQGNDVLSKHI